MKKFYFVGLIAVTNFHSGIMANGTVADSCLAEAYVPLFVVSYPEKFLFSIILWFLNVGKAFR